MSAPAQRAREAQAKREVSRASNILWGGVERRQSIRELFAFLEAAHEQPFAAERHDDVLSSRHVPESLGDIGEAGIEILKSKTRLALRGRDQRHVLEPGDVGIL